MSILNPLADLVAWVIMRIHAVMGAIFGPATGAAWGLSIVILVVLIRICLIPLFVKQVNAQRKMAQHAPQLTELRKKYKNDKQRLNEETMKFYKENGVNPLAGCLPMIPQMIIFFSLFYVLREIAIWKPGQVPKYGLTVPVLESAQKATILGVQSADIGQFWKALEFVRSTADRFDFEAMLTTRYPLEKINEAIRSMQAFREIKPLVLPWAD